MKDILYDLFDHNNLTYEQAKEVMLNISEGAFNDCQLSAFMSVFLMRAIDTTELSGFCDALVEKQLKPQVDIGNALDIVGTGGDSKDTFNISTLSCFVLAGAGYKICKHGNYGASSVSGASNVLERSGVAFSSDKDKLQRSIDESNVIYLHAPLFNPAMKSVAPSRKQLAVRTFFNLLGPLLNPLSPKNQFLGVYNLKLMRLYTYILASKNVNYSIVHSLDGYDEISLTGKFKVSSSTGEKVYTPASLNLPKLKEEDLGCQHNAEIALDIFLNVLEDKATPEQELCVLLNSAFAINVLERDKSIEECMQIAKESIESKKAMESFKKFVEINS